MIRFNSDYTEGCHPAILKKTRRDKHGTDGGIWRGMNIAGEAAERIKAVCEAPDANVHFLVGEHRPMSQ